MDVLDGLVAACLIPLAIAAIVSGLDDLALDVALAWSWLRRKRTRQSMPRPERERLPEKRIAVLIPLWREEAVIGRMLERNLGAVRYRNYQVFAGAYPNDPATMEAVREAEERYPNVHLAVVPHNGPTSKADCLNWIVQAMRAYEEACGERFDIAVTHDAEDVLHPDSLSWINLYAERYDMIQVPVLPLATPSRKITHGVYCDEFAEYQTKDVPMRTVLKGFLPSNGVGTGYTRRALDRLAEDADHRIFDPNCLTEDYDCGLRLHRLGFPQIFIPLSFEKGEPVATREYFPQRFRQAFRQRTRWVTGICLQSWAKHGWGRSAAQLYWFWRDRKGLIGNPLSLLGNLVCLYGLATLAWSKLSGNPWSLGACAQSPGEQALLGSALLLQLHRLLVRTLCTARIYGAAFAAGTPLRAVWANWINGLATLSALHQYARARLLRVPLVWLKTEHTYPAQAVEAARPEEAAPVAAAFATRPEILRTLPWRLMRRWEVVPTQVSGGTLYLASKAPPAAGFMAEIRRHTRLRVRVQIVPQESFDELLRRAEPTRRPAQVR